VIRRVDRVPPLAVVCASAASPVLAATGGILEHGALVMVRGRQGRGKSTEVLCAAVELARALSRRVLWLDAEQPYELFGLVVARVAGAEGCIDRIGEGPDGAGGRLPPFRGLAMLRKALRARERSIVCVDSFSEAFAEEERREALELMRGRLAYLIAHTNKAGGVYGSIRSAYRVDAMLVVTRKAVAIDGKCRWSGPRRIERPPFSLAAAEEVIQRP
jgi:hypothetical protein